MSGMKVILGREGIASEAAVSCGRQQEPGTAGHFAFAVRKQRVMNAGAQLTFSLLLSLEPWPQGKVLPTFNMVLPTSVNTI